MESIRDALVNVVRQHASHAGPCSGWAAAKAFATLAAMMSADAGRRTKNKRPELAEMPKSALEACAALLRNLGKALVPDEPCDGPAPAAGAILDETILKPPPEGATGLVPAFPEGTPQHDAYAADLRTELDKFAKGEDPYPFPSRIMTPSTLGDAVREAAELDEPAVTAYASMADLLTRTLAFGRPAELEDDDPKV